MLKNFILSVVATALGFVITYLWHGWTFIWFDWLWFPSQALVMFFLFCKVDQWNEPTRNK